MVFQIDEGNNITDKEKRLYNGRNVCNEVFKELELV